MDALWTPQYYQKVLALDPIAYWMLDEKSGAVAYDMVSGHVAGARNGTHVGVTLGQPGIGDGRTSPLYDGTNDYTNVQSAALTAAFNGDAGSMFAWARVSNAAVWTDLTTDTIIRLEADGDNTVSILKTSTGANLLRYFYVADGVMETKNVTYSSTDWFSVAATWERPGSFLRYLNGVPDLTDVINGVWAGPLAVSLIGAQSVAPANTWNGWGGPCAVWDYPLSPAAIANLAVRE